MNVRSSLKGIAVAGVMTCAAFALALPSTACLGDMTCGDGCFGAPESCFQYSESGCPRDACTVTERCHCNGPCTEDVCDRHVNATECAADSVCAWGNACTTKQDGCFELDQGRCDQIKGCRWERNCD